MLERLHWWSQEADPIVSRIQSLDQEERNLEHLQALFKSLGDAHLDLSRLTAPMKLLYVGLSECPINEDVSTLPDSALVKNIAATDRRFVMVAGLPEHAEDIETAMTAHGCQPLSIPP